MPTSQLLWTADQGPSCPPLTPRRAYLASWPHQFHRHLRGNKNTRALLAERRLLKQPTPQILDSCHLTPHPRGQGCRWLWQHSGRYLWLPTEARNCKAHFFHSTQLSMIRASRRGKPCLPIKATERTLQPSQAAHPVWATSQEANGPGPQAEPF